MGSGSKKHKEVFSVAPGAAGSEGGGGVAVATDETELQDQQLPEELQLAVLQLQSAQLGDGLQDGYDQLAYLSEDAQAKLAAAEADGLDPQLVEEADLAIKQATRGHLEGLEEDDLAVLAAAEGFDHPTLVGLSDSDSHPLVHWLDPAYADDVPSKAAIQHKAAERYQTLAAGGKIDGIGYDDVLAAEAALGLGPKAAGGGWEATPAEVSASAAELQEAIGQLPSGSLHGDEGVDKLAAVVAAERRLCTAECDQMGESLKQLQASSAHLVDQQLDSHYTLRHAVSGASEQWVEDGHLTEQQAQLLGPQQALALARASTPAEEQAELAELADTRAAEAGQFAETRQAFQAHLDDNGAVALPDLDEDPEALAAWRQAASEHLQARAAVADWTAATSYSERPLEPPEGAPSSMHTAGDLPGETTTAFRKWAKGQPLGQLRGAAAEAGLDDQHTAATRADVQNFLAASWDPAQSTGQIQTKVNKQAAAKQAKQAGDGAAAPTGTTAGTGPASSSTQAASGWVTADSKAAATTGSFGGKLDGLVAKLRAHQAAAVDLPDPLPDAEVQSFDFGPGKAFTGGGMHHKTVHDGPDGNRWLFKPDKTGGARAHAEAAAAKVFRRAGVAGVGVHVTDVKGTTGAIQPLVSGAEPIGSSPSSWSQAQVDAMVGMHVAAWAVGDHDGHSANVLSTPSGGLMACDQGQAFKFYGSDKLQLGWKPNSNPKPAVYQQAYQAAAAGGLADGVTVSAKAALPTIKAFEAIADGQYRQWLTPVATQGVATGRPWVASMRARAASKLDTKTSQVTDEETVDAFLGLAVERKNRLRSAFSELFASLGLADADHLGWVG